MLHRLGEQKLTPTPDDLAAKIGINRLGSNDVSRGELITEDAFNYKRPGTGITSKEVTKFHIGHKFTKTIRRVIFLKDKFFESRHYKQRPNLHHQGRWTQ